MILTLNTAPATEPVTTVEARAHLNVDTLDDDAYIETLIKVARQNAENFTNRALITQTWDYWIDRFPFGDRPIELPKAPLQSVGSVKYIDENGTEQTLSAATYTVDADSEPGRIYLAYNKAWPQTRVQRKAVHIEYDVGYGNANEVPAAIKQAMLLMIGHWYENREDVVVGVSAAELPMASQYLLSPYKVWTL